MLHSRTGFLMSVLPFIPSLATFLENIIFSTLSKNMNFIPFFFTPLWRRGDRILWEHSSCLTAASSAPRSQHVWKGAVLLTSAGNLPLLAAADQREFKLAIRLTSGFALGPLTIHAACMRVSTRTIPSLSLNLGTYDKMAHSQHSSLVALL